jgi:UDP-N-acetylmuramyl pentapeptide phosphotransferase/UDP-N-acetylglucosamine-1-phosphate transferase
MYIDITIAVCCALALSLGMNRAMLALAPSLGLMDEPGKRRIHSEAIPRAGGIAIWLSFLMVIGGGLAAGWLHPSGHLSWSWLAAFMAGSLVLIVIGFFDDRAGLPPLMKLTAHVLAPTVFFLMYPIKTGLFPEGWSIGCDYLVFVVWVVVLINAFNLIDGLDGLCGGLSAVASVAMAVLAVVNDRLDSALLLLVMGGAILGFLKYNLNPARMFLGDAGSMLMGFFLATVATDAVGRKAMVGVILLPIAVAGVPLLDVLLAIWRRSAQRLLQQLRGDVVEARIFEADSDHLHHRLLEIGGSQRKAATLLHGIAVLLTLLAFLPMMFGDRVYGLSLVGFMIVAMVGVRNLARVEIEHTGSVIHMVIKLPVRRRRLAALLFFYDMVVLVGSGGVAVLMETNRLTREGDLLDLVRFVILFTILGEISLLACGVHRRLWVRTTQRDILAIQFGLLIAAIGTFTLFSLIHSSLEWSALRLTAMSFLFACVGVCLPRQTVDLLREFGLDARNRNPKFDLCGDYGPMVVLGAGDLGTLLLEHLKSSPHDFYHGLRILGFIDEMPDLHGRRLRASRILGGLSIVPELVEGDGLKGIILAINNPRQELLDQLAVLASQYDLKIYRWRAGLEEF